MGEPYGYDMFQDPDVVKEMMDNIAKIMKRNAELYAANEHLIAEMKRLKRITNRKWVIGNGDAFI